MQLTAKLVATLVKRPGRYHDGHGLILVVVNPNNASWQLRYQRNGRERWLGLGPLHTVTLKDARERARAARLQLLDGMDPIDARRAERAKATQVVTFKAAAEAYNALHEQKWRNAKHRKQFLASLACYALPCVGRHDGLYHRHGGSASRCGTDLAEQNRDGKPRSRAHRERAGLGNRAGSSQRR
jgi:Arm DNA-binding domain